MVTRVERMEQARRLVRDAVFSMGVSYSEDSKLSEAPGELARYHAAWLDYVDGGEMAPLRYAFTEWRSAVIEAHKSDGKLFT